MVFGSSKLNTYSPATRRTGLFKRGGRPTKRNGLFSKSYRRTRIGTSGNHTRKRMGLFGKSHKKTHLGNSHQIRHATSSRSRVGRPSKLGGKLTSIKGSIKQTLGRIFRSPRLVASGTHDKLKGQARGSMKRRII